MSKNISMQTSVGKRLITPGAVAAGLGLAILLAGAALPMSNADAAEPKWPSGPFKYLVIDQDLRDALTEFGRNIGVQVTVSDALAGRRIRGKMPDGTAEQYVKRLCETYGVVWFFDGTAMHFSADNELKNERVDLGPISSEALNKQLKKDNVIEAKYPVRIVDAHTVTVYGPPPYIGFVKQTVITMQKARNPQGPKVRVIRGGVEGT